MKTMEGKVWQLTGADTTCGCEAIGQLFIDSAERPRTASATDGSTFVWSVDQQLTLFQGQHTCIKHFQSRIDDVALAPGGLIAVAESRGSITVGVLQTSETGILFKEKNHCNFVPENERFADVTFVKVIFQVCEEESSCRLMCLSSGGLLLVFRNIRLLDGDIDLSAVKVDKLRTSHSQSWDVAATESNVYTVGGGASCLNVFSCEDEGQLVPQEQVSEDGDPEMRALAVLSNGDALLTMDSKGTFYLFDTVVLMVVHTWSGPGCVDFRIVDPRSDKPFKLENFKLVALVPQEEKVQLLSLPDRRSLFEQRISGRASLGKALMSQEEIFTTEWKSIEDEDGAETTVVYRCYAETNPQQRLLRLIAKKRFAEAQELATMYGLDYNFVPHIVQSKIWQTFPTLAEMEDHLRQCATELKSGDKNDPFQSQVKIELMQIQRRFKAYKLVLGKGDYRATDWEVFRDDDPYKLFCQFLLSDVGKAFSLWTSLEMELQRAYVPGMLCQLLANVPITVDLRLISDWLTQHVLAFVIGADPDAVNGVVDWTKEQVGRLELGNEDSWTEQALELCQAVLQGLQTLLKGGGSHMLPCGAHPRVQVKLDSRHVLSQLYTTIDLLKQLQELKSKFGFRLSLHSLSQETKAGVVHRMLDKVVAVDMLPATLREQVLPYVRHHGLDVDTIFAAYVEELIQTSAQPGLQCVGSDWETKAKAIVDVISGPVEKVKAAQGMLEHTPLPIPEAVVTVVTDVIATVRHPLVELLVEKWQMKEADNLLQRYGLPICPMSVAQVKEVAKYMVAQDQTSSWDDAHKFLTAHRVDMTLELAYFYTRVLVMRKQLEKVKTFVSSQSRSVGKKCLYFIVSLAEGMMEDMGERFMKALKEKRLLMYDAAIKLGPMLGDLEENALEREEALRQGARVKQARDLEIHFGICVGSRDVWGSKTAEQIFRKHIGDLSRTMLLSLSRLLELSRSQTVVEMLTAAAEQSTSEVYRKLFMKLVNVMTEYKKCPNIHMVDLAFDLMKSDKETVTLSLQLLKHVAVDCRLEILPEVLRFCSYLSVVENSLRVCQDHGDFEASFVDSLVADWGSDDFVEKSRNLRSEVVLTDVLEGFLSAVPGEGSMLSVSTLSEGDSSPGEESNCNSNTIVASSSSPEPNLFQALEYFNSCGHTSLAFQGAVLASTPSNPFLPVRDKLEIFQQGAESAVRFSASLLTKMLGSQRVDLLLALSHLTFLPTRQGLTLVKNAVQSCRTNYKRLKQVSQVAVMAAEMHQDEQLMAGAQRMTRSAKWGNRLRKIGVDLELQGQQGLAMVDHLVRSPFCGVREVQEFFDNFNLDQSELDPKLVLLLDGHLSQCSGSAFTAASLRKAQEILAAISHSRQHSVLSSLLKKTSSYDYEILEFLLQELQEREKKDATVKNLQLLRFLGIYTRNSPPGDLERKECSQWTGTACDLPELNALPARSATRLPFHSLVGGSDIWAIVRPELNPHSLDKWLQMAPLLSVNSDNLVIAAATIMTKRYVERMAASAASASSSSSSSMNKGRRAANSAGTNVGVSEEFVLLLQQMNDVLSKLKLVENAVFFCCSTVDDVTSLEEKVLVLKGSIGYAKKWLQSAQETGEDKKRPERAAARLTSRLLLTKTQLALVRCGVAEEEVAAALLKKPEELLQKLYSLPCVLRAQQGLPGQHDINELADLIGELHELDLCQIRLALLDKWLMGPLSGDDIDQTITFDVFPTDENDNEEEDNIQRALYLLGSKDSAKCLDHIASIVNNSSLNMWSKKRSLFCFIKTASEEDCQTLLGKQLEDVSCDLEVMNLLCELESLGVLLSMESFVQADKTALLTNLLASHKHQKKATDLVICMALDYEVYDQGLWRDLLLQLIRMGWVEDLKLVLFRLHRVTSLHSLPAYVQAEEMVAET